MCDPVPAPEAEDLPPKAGEDDREGYGWGV